MAIWTQEQERAINRAQGAICVAAGAGAGKTGVIVARFLRLVRDEHIPADQILTITYTEKAAQEMKRRIVEGLEREGLLEERRRVEYAYIHTIHGLCRRLLAENPFEAGVDPQFRVLDDREGKALWNHAIEEVVQDALEEGGAIARLIGATSSMPVYGGNRNDLLNPLRSLLNPLIERVRNYGLSCEEIAEWGQRELQEVDLPFHPALEEYKRQMLSNLEAAAQESGQALLISAVSAIKRIEPDTNNPMHSWLDQVVPLLSELSNQAKQAQSWDLRDLGQANSRVLASVDPEKERQCAELASGLLQLIAQIWQRFDVMKQQAGGLDFEDLQQRMLQLLKSSENVTERYRRRFKYIMVDEYQDINPVQAKLLEHLGAEGNWMIVGDERQAIYRFRFADVNLFRRQIEQIGNTSTQNPERAASIPLQINFRSRPEILNFVATVFSKLWHGDNYQALETGRDIVPKKQPSIELWMHSQIFRRGEAEWIASEIRSWVQNKSLEVYDSSLNAMRPVRYGDIAVLMRQFTRITDYEQAFQAADIPFFVVGGGRGYFTRYEVHDLKNALQSLCRPDDDLAIACLLRSTMVGVSMDSLVCLSNQAQERGSSLYETLKTTLEVVPEADVPLIKRFLEWFEPLLLVADRLSVGVVLERLLVETEYDAKLLCRENGAQQLANVRKLIQMSFETPDVQLSEFVERISTLTYLRQREGDAPTHDEFSDVVRFITVHSAKGLEFPVVIMADLDAKKNRHDQRVEVDLANQRIGVEWRNYSPLIHRQIQKQEALLDQQEELRLIYVAMTRAKEHLVITTPQMGQQQSWALLIRPAIPLKLRQTNEDYQDCEIGNCTVRVKRREGKD